MSLHHQPSWTRPESAASKPGPAATGAGGDASSVWSGSSAHPRESRRVKLGIGGLILLSLVILNLGIYQSAERELVQDRWNELAQLADARRTQIRTIVQNAERQSRYLAGEQSFRLRAGWAADGRLRGVDREEFEGELDRAVQAFDFRHLVLMADDGRVLARSRVTGERLNHRHAELVRRAIESRGKLAAHLVVEPRGAELEFAVPIHGALGTERMPVLVVSVGADPVVLPVPQPDNGIAGDARVFVVRRDGRHVEWLTNPDSRVTAPVPPVALTDPRSRSESMAATGIESRLEDGEGSSATANVTRYLPELEWGVVARADRRVVMAAMRDTVNRLIGIDVLLLAAIVLVWWLWRRNFERGLARAEVVVTARHAARMQAVFDTAFDAILTFDRSGHVLTANRAAEHLFGRTTTEMEGGALVRYLRWGSAERSHRGELPTPGVVCVAEAIRSDGRTFPAEFSCGLSGEGDDLVYTAIVRDISDRVEAERRIRAFAEGLERSNRRLEEVNAQLEEASRLKSEFLANTSHELRTPLNGMIGFLQLVLDGMCESPEEERDFLRQALQCSRHLLGLINDVLDIAKIEAGKLTLDIEKTDVETLFAEVHTVTHVQGAQRGIQLRFECPPEPVHVRCDFAKTKQVLINLVGNSLKFTPKGSITVMATPHPDLGHVTFRVIDTGIGIPRDKQHLIFDKFAQGDGSTTRKYGGTGLGLAISRSLVELQGGIIGVHSDGPGHGTTLYFSLPLWQEQQEAPTPVDDHVPETISGPEGGGLVLVVEDDAVFRRYVTTVLHAKGYRTVEANHAEAGWAITRRLRPSAVVLDYALTCAEGATLRTGWDLAVRITTETTTRHIPVLFLTGFDDEVREKLRSTAFARQPAHLVKPIDANALVEKLEGLIGAVSGRPVRVLMADDDPSVAAFVRKVLAHDRFQIELASDGQQCLHILRTQPNGFDLLLLDLMMPDVSGYDVLREMTLTGLAADLPVLVLTNFPEARTPDEKRLLQQGLVLDVVAKTAVHDNPQLLAHLLDWHMQVAHDGGEEPPEEMVA